MPLLRDVVTEEKFVAGDISTNYLPTVYPDGFAGNFYYFYSYGHNMVIFCLALLGINFTVLFVFS